jgi:predicted dehydrogenase
LLTRRLVRRAPDGATVEDLICLGSFDEDYAAEMDAFVRRIDGHEALGATGEDGLRALEIVLSVRSMSGLPRG